MFDISTDCQAALGFKSSQRVHTYEFEEACVAGIEVSVKGRNQWADPKIVKQIIGAICWYLEGIT